MINISPFRLFKLPSVARDDVLKSMSLQELIPLSAVSNKSKQIVKSFAKQKSYKLHISVDPENFYMELSYTNGETLKFTIEGFQSNSEENVTFFEKDRKGSFEFLLSKFYDVFNPEISLNLDSQNESRISKVLDVIKKTNVTLEEALIACLDQNDSIFQKILEVSSKNFELQAYPSNCDFQYEPSNGPMKFDSLIINYCVWAKLEYFMDCKSLELMATELKVNDLIQFIKKWTASNSPMEYFKVQMNCDFSSIGNELSLTPIQQFDTPDNGHQEFREGNCFQIQRTDGKKAIIYRFCLCVIFETV